MKSGGFSAWGLITALLVVAGCGGFHESSTGGGEEVPGSDPKSSEGRQHGSGGETRVVLQSHGFDDESPSAVAVDRERNIVVLASFRYVADFGTGPLVAPSPEAFNLALVKYRWDGTALWARAFGTAPGFTGDVYARSLAVDRDGSIVFAGRNLNPIDFGGGPIPAGGFLVKLDAGGQHVWSRPLHVDPNRTRSGSRAGG